MSRLHNTSPNSEISFESPLPLVVSDMCKTLNGSTIANNISFFLRHGEVLGLIGPNGAGKTTIISMVLGLLTPTSGSIKIAGVDISERRSHALSHANFVAAYAPLPGNLRVIDTLRLFGRVYGVTDLSERIGSLLDQLELSALRNKKCGELSSGEQIRVSIAKALLNRPKLLVLDEPTASLDPNIARNVRTMIRHLSHDFECGVLWTTHNMKEVEEFFDRVLFLSKGQVLLDGDPLRLPRSHNADTLESLFLRLAQEPVAAHGEH